MGDPNKTRKKYSTPNHPWQKERIDEESALTSKYAFKNKKEIWKMSSMLKGFKEQTKKLGSLSSKQAEKEKDLLLKKLKAISLLKEDEDLDSILILKIEDIIERRLQTIVCKKGLARSMKQARQFITHGHIEVNGKVITSPSYILLKVEENSIKFKESSQIANPEHPERQIVKSVKDTKTEKKEESLDKKDLKRKKKAKDTKKPKDK